MPAAFVTGGSGFIGGALVRRLLGEGWSVRALARSEPAAATVEALGAEPVRGDLEDEAAMREGATGCQVAFHAAAQLGHAGDWASFERANVAGTERALAACRAAGVRRFVHVGTEAALFDGGPLVMADERSPLQLDARAPYAQTKARAEAAVIAANEEGGFETVSIRPRFVWGPGDRNLLPALADAVRSGRWAWIGGGRHLTSTTHVDNVVEGLMLGAEHGRPGNAYFVTDGEPVTFREFVTRLLETDGLEPPDRSVPRPLARAIMEAGEAAWRLLPLPGDPPLTRFALWVASEECTIDISKAREQLDYRPVTSIEEGLAGLRAAGSATLAASR